MNRKEISIKRFPPTSRRLLGGLVLSLAALTAAPLATTSQAAHPQAKPTINIGENNFAESEIIGDMYSLLLQKHGFGAKLHVLGSEPALPTTALRRGDLDIFPEYTGTGLQVLGITRIVTSPTTAYNTVKNQYAQRFHITWLQQSAFNDTNGVAVTQATSRKYGLHTLSDLAKVAKNLTFAALSGCKGRPDCLGGFQSAYGIQFKTINYLDSTPLRYSALKNGQADAIEVFTTDAPIQADHLVVLADNKHAVFPADHIAPLVRNVVLQKNPEIRTILDPLARYLTTGAMIKLNGQVILQSQDAMNVARTFLKSKHLL
ncbi:MAG TPA: glycine betaine ABC transporter substrate-binding protein [Chloroflexota bacterium]|jgi:glycine betaine/choline ABC-type transport system substrate-binding protein